MMRSNAVFHMTSHEATTVMGSL